MKEILLGTIGSGIIVKSILSNVAKIDGIKLIATYSRNLETANKLKEEFFANYAYDNIDEFVNSEYINTIYIASPNSLHFGQAKKALEAKKNVILEKPFTPRLSEAKELLKIAEENGVMLIDATPTFNLPNLKFVKDNLNKLGTLKLVMGNYSQYSRKYDALMAGETPNVFNREFAGGCLMDINYYNIYLTTLLFGKPNHACYKPNLHTNGIDTSGVVNMVYDGFVASLSGAKDTWGVNYYQIEGDKGYIYVTDGSNGLVEVKVVTKESEEAFNEQPNTDRWYYDVLGIVEMLLSKDKTLITENHNKMLDAIEVIETVRRKADIEFIGD